MHGPAERLIKRMGVEYTIRNASGGAGGRETPDYSSDGTVTAVLEQRGMPRTLTDSAGEEIMSELELRAILDGQTIHPAGTADGYPTLLDHPDGITYRVVDNHPEDSGVAVLSVVRD